MDKIVYVNGFVTLKMSKNCDVNEVREKIAYSFGYFGDMKSYSENSSPKMSPRGKIGSVGYSITNDNKYIVISGNLTDRDYEYFSDIKDWFESFITDLKAIEEITLNEYTLNISTDDGQKMILLKEKDQTIVIEEKNEEK